MRDILQKTVPLSHRSFFFGIGLYVIATPLFLLFLSIVFVPQKHSYGIFTPTVNPTASPAFQKPTFSPQKVNPKKVRTLMAGSPINGATSSDIPTAIALIFDQPVQAADISFSVTPNFSYDTKATGNILTISPKQALLPGTSYFFVLRLYKPDGSLNLTNYSFTTPGQQLTPTPSSSGVVLDQYNQQLLLSAPDVYVANQLPYQTLTFSASATLSGNHYLFTILGKDTVVEKNDFSTWLKSIGLSDTQIQTLKTSYQVVP